MEPKTMERLQKIQELAKNIFGSGYVMTGFEKHDDTGTDVRHNSDGSRALIKPWQGNGRINQSSQPYLRFFTESNKQWYDSSKLQTFKSILNSICELY